MKKPDTRPTEPHEIDEVLEPFAYFVAGLGDLYEVDPSQTMRLDRITMDLPVELEVYVDDSGQVRFGSSPPTQYFDTSFLPVFHQLRVTVELDEANDA